MTTVKSNMAYKTTSHKEFFVLIHNCLYPLRRSGDTSPCNKGRLRMFLLILKNMKLTSCSASPDC